MSNLVHRKNMYRSSLCISGILNSYEFYDKENLGIPGMIKLVLEKFWGNL